VTQSESHNIAAKIAGSYIYMYIYISVDVAVTDTYAHQHAPSFVVRWNFVLSVHVK